MGVLSLIDEMTITAFKNVTEKDMITKFESTLSANSQFVKGSLKLKGDFGIKHYAGEVPYNAKVTAKQQRQSCSNNRKGRKRKEACLWTNNWALASNLPLCRTGW
jgi:myosin heavy subunit